MRNLLPAILLLFVFDSTAQNFTLNFNGTTQYISIPDQNSIDLSTNFTIEGWIYPTGSAYDGIIVNKENSYEIARFNDGTLQFALSASGLGNDWTWINTGLVTPLNEWSHFAMIKSGTTVTFYLNGSSSSNHISQPASLSPNSSELRIGNRSGLSQYFGGRIEEIRIWNTSRTQSEVKASMFNKNLANNAAGMVAYYRMNEGSGTTTINSCTNSAGINGTLINGPAWVASPVQYGANAISFDGTNDMINIPDDNTLDITSALTLEAWCYAIKNTGIQNVISKSSNTQNNGYIFPRTDNGWSSVILYFHIAGGWRTLSAPYPSLYTWHHLAATYDGASIKLYINGVLAASQAQTGTITANSNVLGLGNQTGYAEYFGGYTDEMRIWNVARTQTEIQNNMDKELNPVTQTGLVSYYTNNQGINNGTNTGLIKLIDQKGNNNGTLSNFALSSSSSNFVAQHSNIIILPVSWLSFTGNKQDKSVQLNWSTSVEQNSHEFNIEHSVDGSAWKNIGTVGAAGNSLTIQTYSYTHTDPAHGLNFYRLHQLDIDGRSSYSKTIKVIFTNQQNKAIVYPNPVTDGTLNILLPQATKIFLYNSIGKLVIVQQAKAGNNQLNTGHLPKGVYQLKAGEETIQILIH
ncbi:MAG: LamG-like jellyroll fold domain-containing protein [Chitinophagaceae bacterium]